jgi:hypothetical protein
MSTVYTVNGKVLKNSANDKWLIKKEASAGFVMNASNAEYYLMGGSYWVSWQAPTYPNVYNGNGKQYTLVNNNTTGQGNNPLMYASTQRNGGPNAINGSDANILGTSTGTLLNNEAADGGYGVYLIWPFSGYTLEQLQAYMANVTITILDP